MLKTNSKQVKEKVLNYIIDSVEDWELDNQDLAEAWQSYKYYGTKEYNKAICKTILDIIIKEKHINYVSYYEFKDYCQGLPSILDCNYYYNVSAKKIIKEWLEETDEEADKYTEEQAEELITRLLYRTITNTAI